MKKRIQQRVAGVLTGILLLSCLGLMLPKERQEPRNPISASNIQSVELALTGAAADEQTDEQQPDSPEASQQQETAEQPDTAPAQSSQNTQTPPQTQKKPQTTQQTNNAAQATPEQDSESTQPDTENGSGNNPVQEEQSENGSEETPTGDGNGGNGTGENTEENPVVNPDADEKPKPDNPENGKEDNDTTPTIVTDLSSRVVTTNELENNSLNFYAYITGGSSELSLRVNVRNDSTGSNGAYLRGTDSKYSTALTMGRNYFTLYIKNGSTTVSQAQFVITYTNQKADAGNPAVGEHPPTIQTNLDNWTSEIKTAEFKLQVAAKDYTGAAIYATGIQVLMDGTEVTAPTSLDGSLWEYKLYFEQPNMGDTEEHTVSVLAWDAEGNSRMQTYTVLYRFVDNGDVNGSISIKMDATTLGFSEYLDEFTCDIRQGEPLSVYVVQVLEENGYEVTYSGTTDNNFYLSRIARDSMAAGAAVPDTLWDKIMADGLATAEKGVSYQDSIGEFDYTRASGWMFSVNGDTYGSESMSAYYPNDGDVIYLRFTLAFGKDIGGTSGEGSLRSYCGSWLNGAYLEDHSYDGGVMLAEATCIEPAVIRYTCQVCGTTKDEPTGDALGHEWQMTAQAEGTVTYTCVRCGEVKTEPM